MRATAALAGVLRGLSTSKTTSAIRPASISRLPGSWGQLKLRIPSQDILGEQSSFSSKPGTPELESIATPRNIPRIPELQQRWSTSSITSGNSTPRGSSIASNDSFTGTPRSLNGVRRSNTIYTNYDNPDSLLTARRTNRYVERFKRIINNIATRLSSLLPTKSRLQTLAEKLSILESTLAELPELSRNLSYLMGVAQLTPDLEYEKISGNEQLINWQSTSGNRRVCGVYVKRIGSSDLYMRRDGGILFLKRVESNQDASWYQGYKVFVPSRGYRLDDFIADTEAIISRFFSNFGINTTGSSDAIAVAMELLADKLCNLGSFAASMKVEPGENKDYVQGKNYKEAARLYSEAARIYGSIGDERRFRNATLQSSMWSSSIVGQERLTSVQRDRTIANRYQQAIRGV